MKKLAKDLMLRRDLLQKAPIEDIFAYFDTGREGVRPACVDDLRDLYGVNAVTHRSQDTPLYRLRKAILNPFILILVLLAGLSYLTDVRLAAEGPDYTKIVILSVMVVWSVMMNVIQESRSANAASRLLALVKNTCAVTRGGQEHELPFEDVVCGDVVRLAAGDMVPADLRMFATKDLFVNESSLTGESEPRELVAQRGCAAHMGSTVVSGSGLGVVVLTGNDTMLGGMAKAISARPPKTSFERGVENISKVLLGFMAVMVPVVFILSGLTKGSWVGALVFAMSVAVGLTPEMLPTIVTTCLARGAMVMSRKKVIIKSLDAMQNLGSIDILCTDKTGTLTKDQVELERYLDVSGDPDERVLRHAYLNSKYQTGLKNLMDRAIIARAERETGDGLSCADRMGAYEKVDEIPFDFERRRMSVAVRDGAGKIQMVTKGAVEEILSCCSHVELDGEVSLLTDALRSRVRSDVKDLSAEGLRVLAVAQKTHAGEWSKGALDVADESDMVLIGYLAFLDPPKESASDAIAALASHGVTTKVLTGDSGEVALHVCRQVGIRAGRAVLGSEVEAMDDTELAAVAEREHVFAKLSPAQKSRLVQALRAQGHVVGFMGDGINDAAALRQADAGISVDTAVDIAKEAAPVILLEKDLRVLEDGIVEGRRTYVNMIKYLKMTASSNFGNMLSMLVASALLPFMPMASLQLILLDMVYSVTCFAIPFDRVDPEMLRHPARWDARSVVSFMLFVGPTSSVFDITTFALLFFVVCPAVLGAPFAALDHQGQALFAMLFQTGWCIESMWTQTLVVHMVRTRKVPFVQSRPSMVLLLAGIAGIALMTALPYTSAAGAFGLVASLPWWFFMLLIGIVAGYAALVTIVKHWYVRRFGLWL